MARCLETTCTVLSFALKLLDDVVVPPLRQFKPKAVFFPVSKLRSKPCGLQIEPVTSVNSLDLFKRSFFGRLPGIWLRLPYVVVYPTWQFRADRRWRSIKKAGANFILSGFNQSNNYV